MSRLLTEATALLTRADDTPAIVVARAPDLIDIARAANDERARIVALQAIGLAHRRLGRSLADSIASLRESTRLAVALGDRQLEGDARISLAMSLAWRGTMKSAHQQLDIADRLLTGARRWRVDLQRASIGIREGNAEKAFRALDQAVVALLDAGDLLWATHGVANRGITHAYRGRVRAGIDDLHWACDSYRQLGASYQRAVNLNNLGFAVGHSGDLPAALRLFDEAAEILVAQHIPLAELPLDRAQVLLTAGLASEAQLIIRQVVADLEASGMTADLADALLMQAQAALFAGDLRSAVEVARRARRSFRGRQAWAAHARYVEVAASFRQDDKPAELMTVARRLVRPLEKARQETARAHVLTMCGRLALALGRVEEAEAHLSPLGRTRGTLPTDLTVQIWLARALLHEARGDRVRALRAVRSGLSVGERARQVLGATDLRSGISMHLEELAQHGLRLAVHGGSPTHILRWMDRLRATSTDPRPARAPLDDELAHLRAAQADLRNVDEEHPEVIRKRIAAIERTIQSRDRASGAGARTGHTDRPGRAATTLNVPALLARLGPGRELVELSEVDGRLLAVVAGAGRCRLVELGPAAPVTEAMTEQRRAVEWILTQDRPAQRWMERERAASDVIDRQLLRPLDLRADEVVLVPPTRFLGTAWAHLPTFRGRALTIAPSALSWSRSAPETPADPGAHRRPRDTPCVLAIAGPGVGLASAELDVLAGLYGPQASILPAERATTAAVLAAASTASILHIAAHGHLPRGNGMFAGVDLIDGRLMVYDIERLPAAPPLVILSACNGASVDDRPGEEFLGLAAAFLAAGTTTLIASMGRIPDTPVLIDLLAGLHRNLLAGSPPARALADAQTTVTSDGDHRSAIIASSFLCLGADTATVRLPVSPGPAGRSYK